MSLRSEIARDIAIDKLMTWPSRLVRKKPRWADTAEKHGHDANDAMCNRWRGDFAGVNLHARCPICNPYREEA